MKLPSIAFTALILSTSALYAQSQFDRELSQLREQRDKAIATAADPINRRYQTSLEQLLRKATQSNDLESAVKIQNELKGIKPTLLFIELRTAIEGTEWTWERQGVRESMTFGKDGVLKHQFFTGKWEIIKPRSVRITSANSEGILEFNEDITTYKAVSGNVEKDGVKGRKK